MTDAKVNDPAGLERFGYLEAAARAYCAEKQKDPDEWLYPGHDDDFMDSAFSGVYLVHSQRWLFAARHLHVWRQRLKDDELCRRVCGDIGD